MHQPFFGTCSLLLLRLFDFARRTPSSLPHAVNLTDQPQPCVPLAHSFPPHKAAGVKVKPSNY